VFAIELLPAGHGDALWIEYGDPGRPHRVLIDGGTGPTYDVLRARVAGLPEQDRRFELMAVTHIDADHIEGMVKLLQDVRLQMEFGDAWFNGWRHLPAVSFGPEQGEMVSALLVEGDIPWNRAFGHGPVCVPEDGPLPVVELEGGLRLTLLGPTEAELAALQVVWAAELRKEGLAPGSVREALDLLYSSPRLRLPEGIAYAPGAPAVDVEALAVPDADVDSSEPNASSITLLAEFEGTSALLSGDAVASVLARSLTRLLDERGQDMLRLDAFKLPHHGSRRNVRDDYVPRVRSDRYLVSTNGSYFHHPDPEAIARILIQEGDDRELWFNYRTEENEMWDDPVLQERWRYRAVYPSPGTLGIRVEL
jgi:hypothetical protein